MSSPVHLKLSGPPLTVHHDTNSFLRQRGLHHDRLQRHTADVLARQGISAGPMK
uniref:Uncharacterized protein n=1 Tax=Oryza sativa subsp. japonica TaxID=39947 RepID=Q6ETV9_ORYSJ|nr:hypothetical protein [Oryza sativa Japonica Group]